MHADPTAPLRLPPPDSSTQPGSSRLPGSSTQPDSSTLPAGSRPAPGLRTSGQRAARQGGLALRPTVTGRRCGALVSAGVALALLGTSGCSRPGQDAEASGASEEQVAGGVRTRELPKVRIATVERREMVQVLETMTKLESEREIQLFPRAAGVVTVVLAEEGDFVERDQVLAEMDDRDESLARDDAEVAWNEAQNTAAVRVLAADEAEARIESARLAARQAERDYERNLALFEGEVASALSRQALETSLLERDRANNEEALAELAFEKAKLDAKQAEIAVDRAKVALERAELALDNRRILAPFAGVIARRDVRVGDTATSGAAVFVLSDVNALRAVFNRPQEELARFRSGLDGGDSSAPTALPIQATAEAVPGVVFPGRVVRVSPTIDPESGQFRVTATLRDGADVGGHELLPGMLVRMDIITDRHTDVLVVPKRALRREGDRRHLLVVDVDAPNAARGSLRRVDVREGFDDEDSVEVVPLEGAALTIGDRVVVIGSRDLVAGDSVRLDAVAQDAGETVSGAGE